MDNQMIGDYLLIKELGKGSLGTVFLAEHRFLKRKVALKMLAMDLVEERGFVQRFEKEFSSVSHLQHPHIVKMHTVSCAEDSYYLVSDYIVDEGGTSINLHSYLQQKGQRLQEEEVVRIVHQVASALDYAHGHNLAHRGIKLNNILVGSTKEGIKVSLADFGLSRVIGTGAVLAHTLKKVAESMGANSSPYHSFLQNYAFLAPEQKLSEETFDDTKGDIYAFGILTYYLIARRFPEGFFDLPSQCAPEYKLNWDHLLHLCLQPDPHKRPSSLCKVLEELTQASSTPRLQKWSSNNAAGQEEEGEEALKPVLRPQELVRPEYEPDPGAIFQTETQVVRYHPSPKENQEIDPLLTEMVVIRGGSFLRGSKNGGRDEMPRHAIHLSSFALDIHPVTNEQFVRFLEAMGGEKDHNNNDIIRLRDSRIKRSGGKLLIESGYAKHPVVGVAWYGAMAYAKWIGKRLPTEAEWEIAARGGHEEYLYPTGQNIERSQANFFSSDTTLVMSYPSNDYGLFDLAGNVYEWCQDWYDYHYYDISAQEPDNPKGPLQGVYRALRGGCWKSLKEDLRCAHRHRNNPGTMNGTYGFRCATDVA